MRLTLIQKTLEEEREAIWLRALENGNTTVPGLMRVTGLSRSQVYERLKRARENRGVEDEPAVDAGAKDREEPPWVELANGPIGDKRDHYRLDNDALSRLPAGPFRIGTGSGYVQVAISGDDRSKTRPPRDKRKKFKPRSRVRTGRRITPEELEQIKAKRKG